MYTVVAASSTEVPTDPTAYYNDFWLYCTYYGEAAARVYYGAWSPPEGTPAPANLATAIAAPGATGQVATAGSVAANPTAVAVSGSSSSSVGEGTEGPSTSAAESTTEASSNDDDPVLADPEVCIYCPL